MNIAVILAAGSGKRLGGAIPKQFLEIVGKPIISHSINAFEKVERIDEICVVCHKDYFDRVKDLVQEGGYRKVKKIVAGGKERYDSTLAAVNAYPDDECNLLFHDAVRPLVTDRIINDCIDALEKYNAVGVAVATTDTIWSINADQCIDSIPNRQVLRNAQTPQCFKRGLIRRAYAIALSEHDMQSTDDCGTIRRYLPDEPIYIVPGETYNIKLTYADELPILEHLFAKHMLNEESRTKNNH